MSERDQQSADKTDDAIARLARAVLEHDSWSTSVVRMLAEEVLAMRSAGRECIAPAERALTDEEITDAWNSAGADRPEAGAADLYLHYMRAIAKAQRVKMLRVTPSSVSAAEMTRLLVAAGYDPSKPHPSSYERFSYCALFQLLTVRSARKESVAIADIAAERQRQISKEGWDGEHDDAHWNGSLALAAACYAANASDENACNPAGDSLWPWERKWWKPKDPRRDLVRAAALIVAEIERMDRMTNSVPDSRGVPK